MVSIKDPQNLLIFNSNFCCCPNDPPPPHLCQVSYKLLLFWATQCWPDLLKHKKSYWLIQLFCSHKRLQLYSCFWLASVLLEFYTNNFIMNSASTRRGGAESSLTSQENNRGGEVAFRSNPGFNPYLLWFTSSPMRLLQTLQRMFSRNLCLRSFGFKRETQLAL